MSVILTNLEIKEIRESLGLSLSEAGKIFGGGRGAFEKYENEENGRKPSHATNTLLLIARENPILFKEMFGIPNIDRPSTPAPFEVQPSHLERVKPDDQIELVKRLLYAEAINNNIPLSGIHISCNPNQQDEGEDARITWEGKPKATNYFPANDCVFELKAREVDPSDLANGVVTKDGNIKTRIRDVLQQDDTKGRYIVLCTKSYSGALIGRRKTAILAALRRDGLKISEDQVEFRDADQITRWINHYQSVALWFLERIGSSSVLNFQSWYRAFHQSIHSTTKFVKDARFGRLQNKLQSFREGKRAIKVTGFSGVGKSRLVLESFSENGVLSELSDFVLYMDTQFMSDEKIVSGVEQVLDSNLYAIVIVDGGSVTVNRRLLEKSQLPCSRVSMIVIEDLADVVDIEKEDELIKKASEELTKSLADSWCGKIDFVDKQLLVDLTLGYPKYTRLICESWRRTESISGANKRDLVEQLLVDLDPQDPNIKRVAKILAVCGRLPDIDSNNFEKTLSTIDTKLSIQDFSSTIGILRRGGILKQYGTYTSIEPRILSLKLAEFQWEDWGSNKWKQVLFGDLDLVLKKSICNQLSLLNETDVAKKIISYFFESNFHLLTQNSFELLEKHSSLLRSFVQIDPDLVVPVIEMWIDDQLLSGRLVHNLQDIVETLAAAAHRKESFKKSTEVLMKIAASSSHDIALLRLQEIFSGLGTEAEGKLRLQILRSWVEGKDSKVLKVLPQLLDSIMDYEVSARGMGPEKHGVKKAYKSWIPKTYTELFEFLAEVAQLLQELAQTDDEIGEAATRVLDDAISDFLRDRQYELAESAIERVITVSNRSWPSTQRTLFDMLHSSFRLQELDRNRLQFLDEKLIPKTTSERLRHFLDGSLLERYSLHRDDPRVESQESEDLQELVKEVLSDNSLLSLNFASLIDCTEYGTRDFGEILSQEIEHPREWLTKIKEHMINRTSKTQACDFLLGFTKGLFIRGGYETELQSLKQEVAETKKLTLMFARLTQELGIKSSDIQLAIEGINEGRLDAVSLSAWSNKRSTFENIVIDDLLRLLYYLVERDQRSYVLAVEIFALNLDKFRTSRNEKALTEFACKIAHLLSVWPTSFKRNGGYYFIGSMNQVLQKGPTDTSARRLAGILSNSLIISVKARGVDDLQSLVSKVFQNFPELALAAIKQEVKLALQDTKLINELHGAMRTQRDESWFPSFPIELLLDWCYEDESNATLLLGRALPFFERERSDEKLKVHPKMFQLIQEFGHAEKLWEGIRTNISSHRWGNKKASYYAQFKKSIGEFCEHDNADIRKHARKLRVDIEEDFRIAKNKDQERKERELFEKFVH
ncbi:MAG: hypothetical protein OXG88_03535 [Gammaproteobacteria bacterium]|nr:hypothetical protein [Gammaproteobacteria bacterium]